jgi:hypothetical protein
MSYKKGGAEAGQKWLDEQKGDFFTQDTTHVTDVTQLHRGQADQQAFENLQRVFNDSLAAVKISEQKRDVSQNQRARYERNWEKLRAAARNYAPAAKTRNIKVLVPKYHAPLNTSAEFEEFVPPPESNTYHETRGRASGLGLPGSGGVGGGPLAGAVGSDGKLTADVTISGVTFPKGSPPPSGV